MSVWVLQWRWRLLCLCVWHVSSVVQWSVGIWPHWPQWWLCCTKLDNPGQVTPNYSGWCPSLWGPLWGSLWNIFSVPQLSTSAHQPNALYSSYFGRQLSGILVTWHCHLTWVSLGGCEYWEFWPFLWTPSLEFCLTIWCREVHRGTLGGNDWGAWHVCCR